MRNVALYARKILHIIADVLSFNNLLKALNKDQKQSLNCGRSSQQELANTANTG